MGAQTHVSTQPAQLVRAPSGATLYFRLSVTNTAATLVSLLPNGVLPTIAVPNAGPGNLIYTFKGVALQSETDPTVTPIRYTDDGQKTPAATGTIAGFLVPNMAKEFIMADPQDIQLVASVAGPTFVQCNLIVSGIAPAGSTN